MSRCSDPTERPREVTLFGRAGCHLCEQARDGLRELVAATGARLVEVDTAAQPRLMAAYRLRIPVIAVEGRVVAEGRWTPLVARTVQAALASSRSMKGSPAPRL